MKKVSIAAAVLSIFALMGQAQAQVVGQAQAQVVGESSNKTMIQVGTSDGNVAGHPGQQGALAIAVEAATTPYNKMTSFASLSGMAPADANGVNVIKLGDMPTSHSQLGNFAFSKIAGQDVYFGEWAKDSTATGNSHTVYYVGKERTANMPTQGTATYTVVGLNNYNGSNALGGTLTANFGTQSLTGSMNNAALDIGIDASINLSDASFSGVAEANGVSGQSQGHFFGNNAASLAGTATFTGNNHLDTAFGGTKNP